MVAAPLEPTVLFHRPGASHLERLLPEVGGTVGFRMHPWEGSKGHGDLVLRGRLVQGPAVMGDERPFEKPSAHAVGGTPRDTHLQAIRCALEAIESGTFEKVVLSSHLTVEAPGLEAETIVRRLSQAHPDSFSWMVRHPDIGIWFGSSPEPLVQGQWPTLNTACLAGTRMAHTGAQSDPWTDKERHEQQLVTDSVLDALRDSGCRNITVGDRMTVRYGPIEHLRTMVSFDAEGGLADIMGALHPTPAVGGTPRAAALHYIAQLEQHDRAYYTGWVGLEDGQDIAYFVNLRCGSLNGDRLTAYAGGGITRGSDPEAEWQETRNKLRSALDPIVHWPE
ncbi:MAG: hypothetical protein CBC74_001275 [Crocinitomicaceae bacterium TMED114]|nr:MAG: hypothetical protein CBC74_001275 [Crocinitomicaceae bacterium TMED114]